MEFIELTLKNDDKFIVNVSIINMIVYDDEYTKVYLSIDGDEYYEVKETYEEIRNKLMPAQNNENNEE